jgi:uncharacterized membrane protein YebE (DUF533 family)
MGIDSDAKEFVIAEMQKLMDLDALVRAAVGRSRLGARLYAVSLLAIEVGTPAEREYLRSLGERLGLNPATIVLDENIGKIARLRTQRRILKFRPPFGYFFKMSNGCRINEEDL